jgi:DnaK suppressor protein
MATSENATKKAEKSKPMAKKQLQHFEKRLLEERKRVLKELGKYDEAFGATSQESDGDLSS